MKNKPILFFVWSCFVLILLVALPSAFRLGPDLIGKSFVDSDDFQLQVKEAYTNLASNVLNPINREEAKKKIPVSKQEIEDHRMRYGTLKEQLENIHSQYEDQISDAKISDNKVLQETLIKERDAKVADIQQNFESDEYVEVKIRAEKASNLDRYLDELTENDTTNFPIAYTLKDINTGETFTEGNVEVPAAYKKQFNSSKGYFKAKSLSEDLEKQWFHINYGDSAVSLSSRDLLKMQNPIQVFEGTVIVSKAVLLDGVLSKQVNEYNRTKYMAYAFWILAVLSLIALFTVLKFNKEWVLESRFSAIFDKWKVDVKAISMFLSLMMLYAYIESTAPNVFNILSANRLGRWGTETTSFIFFALIIAFIAFQLVNSIERWKHKGVIELDFKNSYTAKFFNALQMTFLNRSIGVQMFLLLISFFLAGLGLFGVLVQPVLIMIYIPLLLLAGLPFLYIFVRRTAYLNRIIVATEEMANGRLHEEIKIEGKSPLADHARNLNNLREGVRVSMTEQAKSERLKTELITNVSHDLRTPLTSIITYTDLLKNEDITVEERKKYVDILDRKSQRLKTLIEDLFEVSKMASGNLELHKQRVDLTQLLQQALAEHEEEISKSGLDFRVNLPESALVAYVDGKRWWRVLDNLIVNAVKYTLPGTRVYITLRKVGDTAEYVVKNVTKYELGENTDELFERFKRADTSRHTDGSGLGLAIAQSIVDLHNGNMKIEVDGDLFKVTVVVAAV